MSSAGISEIKKKAKLSLDEMYDDIPVGVLDNQKENKPEKQLSNNPAIQHSNSPIQVQADEPQKTQPDLEQISHSSHASASLFTSSKQPLQKIPTYKMTFNLSEGVYKAFNNLYANRMIQGRKTEKSEMICEAIQWLIKMEEEQADRR